MAEEAERSVPPVGEGDEETTLFSESSRKERRIAEFTQRSDTPQRFDGLPEMDFRGHKRRAELLEYDIQENAEKSLSERFDERRLTPEVKRQSRNEALIKRFFGVPHVQDGLPQFPFHLLEGEMIISRSNNGVKL